ncbi:uncharacterized protein LOC125421404 [Ziziphus jujuba]|uniref:Uncharacterized protein LOC125421404 n=1 Tax=Ziziphus jujuba TaxID=326968 RepID=A0ABM3IDV1_ZIZJJ|nr:uncharacterized protein LOC125421404 [Ziziphus jujuba]
MAEIVFLKSKKLRELAELIYGCELESLQDLYFKSEEEQVKYLRTCKSNMDDAENLLHKCGKLVKKYENDSIRSPIASLILSFTETSLNSALQVVRNYTLRRDYLDKVIAHVHNLIKELDELDAGSAKDVADLTNQIRHYNKAIKQYVRMSANSEASKEFSSTIYDGGIDFPTLVQTYQTALGFGGEFKHLKDDQKLLVYDSIIEASGRGKVLDEETLRAIGSYQGDSLDKASIDIKDIAGKAHLLFKAASIAWDIYTAENPIKEAARSAVVEVAKKGGAVLGDIVGAAATAAVDGAAVTDVLVCGIGMVAGFAASFILGIAAGALFDLIFGSGGSAPLPSDGLIFHVASMPDGMELARRIA